MKQSLQKIIGQRTVLSFALAIALIDLCAGVGWAQSQTANKQTPAQSNPTAEQPAVDDQTQAVARTLVVQANQLQAAGELKRAAELWVQVLDEDVPAVIKSKAHFNAGLLYSQLRDFESSISHFNKGLEVATPESAAEVPQALFYLGYGQLELGRMLQAGSTEETDVDATKARQQRADELLTTSSQTLGRLQRRFPSFAGVDQAAFFQAKAFESLGRLKEAAESYQTVLSFKQPMFGFDAQFGLADTLEKLGQPDESLEQYRSLIAKADLFSAQQKPLLVESEFRAAELLMKLGDASRGAGDTKLAVNDYADAFELYSAVIDQKDNAQLVPLAIYGAAWSKLNSAVGENRTLAAKEADEWFTRLIEAYPDHRLVADATTARDSARTLTAQLADKATDVDNVTTQTPDEADREQDRLELGLAHVKQAEWNDAIEVFENLIKDFPDSPAVDRYRYELAWALESLTPPMTDAAMKQFAAIAESMPNSPFADEAHFHLGTDNYDQGRYEMAAKHFKKVLASDLPAKVLERASFQLGWAEYRQKDFSAAADQFQNQLKVFPAGSLATDAKVMFAESQFQQDKHSDALQAYLVAKPAVDADGNIDPKMQMLTALHGAQSANESAQYDEAIRFATPVTLASDIPEAYQADAWLEIGMAQAGNGNRSQAMEAWQKAVGSLSVTGARARSLLGEALAGQQQFQEALNQYKLVYFGFGGVDADDDVRPWQAYALYEAARLNQSLAREAVGPVLRQRIDEAIGQYERLLKHYSESDTAEEAKRQLEKLKAF